MFAPKSRCLPEYQASMVGVIDIRRRLGESVGVEQFAVEDDV
jgi:hypothetical protein